MAHCRHGAASGRRPPADAVTVLSLARFCGDGSPLCRDCSRRFSEIAADGDVCSQAAGPPGPAARLGLRNTQAVAASIQALVDSDRSPSPRARGLACR